MEDNRRTTHSVDDYYPKPSRDEEPSQENLSNRPDAEDTERTTPVPTAQIPMVLMRMLPMKTAALVFPITVATRILTARAATALRSMQVGR